MTFDALARAKQRIAAQPPSPDGFEDVLLERLNAVTVAYASAVIAEPFIGCGCCTTPEYLEKIRVTPIMDLDDRTVFDIVSSLGLTYGQERDLAHFVPRFCVDGIDHASYDTAFAFSRMAAADFAHWPTAQRDSVRDFLLAQLRFLLGHDSLVSGPLTEIAHLYQCFSYLGYDREFFETWECSPSKTADQHFEFLIDHIALDEDGAFYMWDDWGDAAMDRLIAWLQSTKIHDRLQRATAKRLPETAQKYARPVLLNEASPSEP
jgi:hypothetical protein